MNSCVGYQHISRFSNIAGANGSSPCFFIGCFVILCNCCPVCLVVQVCSDVPGIDISLPFQLGIRVSASLIDCIGNRRIDRITGNQLGIALGYRTIVVGRYFIGNSTRLFIRGMGNCHTVTRLNFDCIFSKVLDDRLAIIRNILEILQIGDIRGIRAYLGIKSTKVLASGVVYFNVIRRTGRLIVVVQRLARYQLVGNRSICGSSGRACSERSCAKSLAPVVFILFLLLWRCTCFCNGFSIFTDCISLQVSTDIAGIRLGIRSQLFPDDDIMGISAVICFDKAIVVSSIISTSFYIWRDCIIIPGTIAIP